MKPLVLQDEGYVYSNKDTWKPSKNTPPTCFLTSPYIFHNGLLSQTGRCTNGFQNLVLKKGGEKIQSKTPESEVKGIDFNSKKEEMEVK
jgi:hypothetical protein